MSYTLPYPYPEVIGDDEPKWDAIALKRNLDFILRMMARNQESQGSLVAFVDAEQSCTNTLTAFTISTGINIATQDGVLIRGNFKKSLGAAADASMGLQLNGVTVITQSPITSAVNQFETGYFEILVYQRRSTYNQSAFIRATNGTTGTEFLLTPISNVLANEAITSIGILGLTGSASVTFFIRDIAISRIPGRRT